jgi:hypothetical protein
MDPKSKAILELGLLKKYLYFLVSFFVFWVALLTSSAANLIVLIGISSLAFILYAKKHTCVILLFVYCAFLALPSILDSLFGYTYF